MACNHYSENFAQIRSELIGGSFPWLSAVRQNALANFIERGIPTRHDEHWKYTNPGFLEQETFAWARQVSSSVETQLGQYQQANFPGHRLVFVNGHFSARLSTFGNLQDKIQLLPLSTALIAHADKLKPYLEQQLTAADNLFAHLNTAFISDGLFLNVAKNVVLEQPIHLLFLTVAGETALMSHPRNVFILEENAQAIIFEEHRDISSSKVISPSYHKNIATQICLNSGAQLDYYKLQNEGINGYHQAITQVQQLADSQFFSHSFSLGAKWARDDLTVGLDAKGACCQLNGLYLSAAAQHVDHHTRIDHHSAETRSEEYYKGVLADQATAVFNGKVLVHPQAQKSKSRQSNKNLLLSAKAQINTKPELEIYADDVQCAHGATTGQVDELALFYLRSRGIDEITAGKLLVHAFVQEIFDKMRHSEIAGYVQQTMTQWGDL